MHETAFLARPMGAESWPCCDLSKDRWKARKGRGEGREGALSWPLTTHWTYFLSIQKSTFWLPTKDVHTSGLGLSLG